MKLRDIITIEKGKKHNLLSQPNNSSQRYIQIDDLRNDNYIKFTDDSTGVLSSATDIIIAWDGAYAGLVGYGKKGLIGSTLAVLKIKDPTEFYYKFLGKFLQSKFKYFQEQATGATIPHISRSSLENLEIPYFSYNEQVKISETLEKAEELVNLRKKSLSILDTFLYAYFKDITENNKKIKINGRSLFKVIGGYAFSSKDYKEHGIPLIRIGSINKGYFDQKNTAFIQNDGNQDLKSFLVTPGDLLITLTGTVGKNDYGNPFLLDNTYSHYYLNQRVAKIAPIQNISITYLYYYFKQPHVKRELTSVSRGVRQANISNNDLYNIQFHLIPEAAQKQFDLVYAKTEQEKIFMIKSLNKLQDLFSVILQNAFNQKLKFNDWIDLKNILDDKQIFELEEYNKEVRRKIESQKALDNFNKALEYQYINLPPVENVGTDIETKIKQLEQELSIAEEIPFDADYTRYRIVEPSKVKWPITSSHLVDIILSYKYFKDKPTPDNLREFFFTSLNNPKPFLKQSFDKERKEIVFDLA